LRSLATRHNVLEGGEAGFDIGRGEVAEELDGLGLAGEDLGEGAEAAVGVLGREGIEELPRLVLNEAGGVEEAAALGGEVGGAGALLSQQVEVALDGAEGDAEVAGDGGGGGAAQLEGLNPAAALHGLGGRSSRHGWWLLPSRGSSGGVHGLPTYD
jgi:hypothetical protein